MKARFPSLLLHFSLMIIVIGALVTHFCSSEEYIHLRVPTGQANETTWQSALMEVSLLDFTIEHYPNGNAVKDYVSHIRFEDGSTAQVSMNHIARHQGYRFIQSGYDHDGNGSTLLAVHDPWGTGITFCGYFLLFAGIILCLIDPRGSFRQLLRDPVWKHGRINMAAWFCIAVGMLWTASALLMQIRIASGQLAPILATPLLSVHVSTIAVSYLLFAAIAVISVVALIPGNCASRRNNLMTINRTLLYPAVLLLCAGIFIGAIWASISWGHYWSWDPKETSALITLLLYCIPLHCPKIHPIFYLIAFIAVLFTFLGVNLLGGMHAYI